MLQTIAVALAIATVVGAQIMPPVLTVESTTTTTTTVAPQIPPSERLVTGGNLEYTKLIKGSIERDPLSWRTYIRNNQTYLSYWHDIPLFFDQTNNILNMVVEVKRGEGWKIETNLFDPMNPLMVSLGEDELPKMQFVDYVHNYGYIPQTFAPSSVQDSRTKLNGDNTPLDIVEISVLEHEAGDVVPVKLLGVLAVIDENEVIDYKLIGIDIHADFAAQLNSLDDVERFFPDVLSATRGFFRYYQYPTQHDIAFDGQYQNATMAMDIVNEQHNHWLDLIKETTPEDGLYTECLQPEAAHQADSAKWKDIAES
jgi:inorganic pyrophosphatase